GIRVATVTGVQTCALPIFLVREGHLDIVQAHAPQRLEVLAAHVRADEDAAAAQCLGALGEHRPRRDRGPDRRAALEVERGPAARRAHRYVRDVLADRRADERNERAVIGYGGGDEVVGVQRGRLVGGRAAAEERVLARPKVYRSGALSGVAWAGRGVPGRG